MGSGICVVQIFGMILSCCLYIKLKDVDQWHLPAADHPDFFAEDPLTDGVSLIYGQEHCPIHSTATIRNGNGTRYRDSQNIDGIYPMDVTL